MAVETIEYRGVVDKSTWGDGPWQAEPDKKQWSDPATGLPCLIVRGPVGALCGYVGVSPDHPLYGKGHDDLDVEVHGGLTFARGCEPEPTEQNWSEWRAGILAGEDEAKKFPRGDAAQRLRDREKELESYEAFATWVRASAICHLPAAGDPDHVWWFGFDCSHYMDLAPGERATMREIGFDRSDRDEVYRDWAYVEREIASLAKQLAVAPPLSTKEGE